MTGWQFIIAALAFLAGVAVGMTIALSVAVDLMGERRMRGE